MGNKEGIRDKLNSLFKNQKMVSIFSDMEDLHTFYNAIIIALSKEEILFHNINCFGEYDGLHALPIDDIIKIEYDSQYTKKIEKLCSIDKELERKQGEISGDNLFIALLKYAKENKKLVLIEMLHSLENDASGYVLDIGDKMLTIKHIDSYGENDGISIIEIEKITELECCSHETYAREKLNFKNS